MNYTFHCGVCTNTTSPWLGPGELSTRAFPQLQFDVLPRSEYLLPPHLSALLLTLSTHTQLVQNPDRGWTPSPFPLFVLLLLARSLNQMINGSIDFVYLLDLC